MIRIYKEKTEEVVRILSETMKDDPLNVFWFPDDTNRIQNLNNLFEPEVKYCFANGLVYATSENMEGVALWITDKSSTRTAGTLMRYGGLSLLFKIPLKILYEMKAYDKYTQAVHHKYAPFPHWYLHNIAVKNEHQGHGFAGELLKPVLPELDRKGIPCYLETQNPHNVSLYEHYGFKLMEEADIPGNRGVKNRAMLRYP